MLINFTAFGQNSDMVSNSCVDKIKIEPGFIAFSTSKNSKIGEWYRNTFRLEIVKEFAFPDGSITGVLMKNNEFVVEIFYRDNILDPKIYVPKSESEQWKGFMKFGIYTNANLPDLKQCLLEKGVNAGRIFNDLKLGIDLLQVVDPEGNIIEIISRKTENRN